MWAITRGRFPIKWYVSTEDLLRALPSDKLEYPPNSESRYSNLGMSLLGIALERASKHSLQK